MKKALLLFLLVYVFVPSASAQFHSQYFEGDVYYFYTPLPFHLGIDGDTLWQIGRPSKTIFNSASTLPNAIVTDTIRAYPPSSRSSFRVNMPINASGHSSILAVRWRQKFDFDFLQDGGIVEFSTDTGHTWQGVFDNPYVYNYYGFSATTVQPLPNGEYAFTGSDTAWKDIWLCFDCDYFAPFDTIYLRYTLVSDTIDNHREGWLMDNFIFTSTFQHTVSINVFADKKIHIYPTLTSSRIHIEVPRTQLNKVTDYIRVTDMNGRMVRQYTHVPLKFFIDMGDLPDGLYLVSVGSKEYADSYQVTLKH